MKPLLTLAVFGLAAAACLTAAGAERLWSAPRVLQTHGECASQTVDVVATGRGRWAAIWDERNPSCDSRYEYRLRMARSRDGSGWRERSSLPQGFEVPALKSPGAEGVQALGGQRVLILGARPAEGRSPSQLNRVLQIATIGRRGVRRRDFDSGRLLYGADGDFGSELPSDADETLPVMDLDADGRGVAVWARLVDDDEAQPRGRLYARYRGADGRFGPPAPLGPAGEPTAPAVAINRNGDAIAAWCQDYTDLLVRYRRHRDSWDEPRRIGGCGDISTALDVALGDDGRVAVAWSSTTAGSGGPASTGVRLALGTRSAMDEPRVLSEGGTAPRVLMTRRGVGIAWSQPQGTPNPGVVFARIGPRGEPATRVLSDNGSDDLVDVEAAAKGSPGIVIWGGAHKLFARRVHGDGSLGDVELVSSTGRSTGFGAARVALGRRGAAVAIWAHQRTDSRGSFRGSSVEAARR